MYPKNHRGWYEGPCARLCRGIQESVRHGSFSLSGVDHGICNKCDFRAICPGFTRWRGIDRTTPRPGSLELDREMEISMVEEDLNAG